MVRGIEDIEADKEAEEREDMKDRLTSDIKDMASRFKPKKKKKGILRTIIVWLIITGLIILVINFVLGNIWLLRFFIKSLFGVG